MLNIRFRGFYIGSILNLIGVEMDDKVVRIGLVGAGNNTRIRHIPGFNSLEGVEIVSVCNSTRESSERVASEFNILKVYDNWIELVRATDTNAICIGTYPNLHSAITLEALSSGKHVLTEARMAGNATEARSMLNASIIRPDLIAQIVPAPGSLSVDKTIKRLISEGLLGDLIHLEMNFSSGNFPDKHGEFHWRHNKSLSGYNIMQMGIWYESLARWIGPATKVMAMSKIIIKERKDHTGALKAIEVPDHVNILCDMAMGGQAHISFSSVIGLAPRDEIWLFGSEGTIKLDVTSMKLYAGTRGQDSLSEVLINPEDKGYWRVEEEFINAIRGRENVTCTSFSDGVRYMDFTEAVTKSIQGGRVVDIPLG